MVSSALEEKTSLGLFRSEEGSQQFGPSLKHEIFLRKGVRHGA